jgi:ScaI restriction endonuclease
VTTPYLNESVSGWSKITAQLLEQHPLKMDTIRDVALASWAILWQTRIGEGETSIRLDEIDVPATVVGYFFEKLFARELERRYPSEWHGSRTKSEKDLVYLPDPSFSIEMKASGQLGTKIFGNRSYNQQTTESSQVSKVEKSGYYITINFYGQILTLIRYGWIDQDDWKAQSAETGQAATLPEEVYLHKLMIVPGAYRLHAPIGILNGVGPKKAELFATEGIETINDLLQYTGNDKVVNKFKEQAQSYTTN